MFAVGLPGAVAKDDPSHSGSGPWSTFFGSNSTTEFDRTVNLTWGPGAGWYLSFVAFALFLNGVIFWARSRKDPPGPVTSMWTADPATSGLPPAPAPPAETGRATRRPTPYFPRFGARRGSRLAPAAPGAPPENESFQPRVFRPAFRWGPEAIRCARGGSSWESYS
jgi:hypothetical protein